MPPSAKPPSDKPASQHIDERVRELGDWRGATLQRMRELIHAAVPEVEEAWMWRGVPVWLHAGGICTGESYKALIKLTFHNGAALSDPNRLFNSSLEGNVRRAIDIRESEVVDAAAFKKLVKAAVAHNLAKKKKPAGRKVSPKAASSKAAASSKKLAAAKPKVATGKKVTRKKKMVSAPKK